MATVRSYARTDIFASASAEITLPDNIEAGDLLVMVINATCNFLRNPDRSGQFYDVTGSWTCLFDAEENAEDNRATFHVKIAGASETNPTVTFQYFLGPSFVTDGIAMVYAFSDGFDPNLANVIHAAYDPTDWYDAIHSHTVNAVDDTNYPGVQIQNLSAGVPETTPPIVTTLPCTIIHGYGEDGITAQYPTTLTPSATSSDGADVHDDHYFELATGDCSMLGVALYTQTSAGTHTMDWTLDDDGGDPVMWGFAIAPAAEGAPVADFSGTPTTVASGGSVTFTDLSTNTPTSWAWQKSSDGGANWTDFQSGGSHSQNPTEVFTL